MKKTLFFAAAATLMLSGVAKATGTTATATKPTQPTTSTTTTVTDQAVQGKKAGIDATTVTEEQKVKATNKAGDVGTVTASKTTVFFTVGGTSTVATNAEYMKLADHLKKAKGVFSANCTYSAKECTAVIDPTVTNTDQILSWAEKGQYKLNVKKTN